MQLHRKIISSIWFFPALVLFICFVFTAPFIRGQFLFLNGEYFLYQSYIRSFIETLKAGELPLWNEYVGGGHPAIYFGHYPIHITTLFYSIFGYSDYAYGWLRFINLSILVFTFIYTSRFLKVSPWLAFLGAWIFFGLNFGPINFAADTVNSVSILLPAVFLLLVANILENFKNRRLCVLYLISLWVWSSGSPITYLFMPGIMLIITFLITIGLYRIPLRRALGAFFALLIAPWLAIAYQFYFVLLVVGDSNRLKSGLVVSFFDPEPWNHFFRSLGASSYIWATIGLFLFFLIKKNIWRYSVVSIYVFALFYFKPDWYSDYYELVQSVSWWASIIFFGLSLLLLVKKTERENILFPFFLITSLLSNFLYQPENITGVKELGYDFMLYQELGFLCQTAINTLIYFSIFSFHKKRSLRLLVYLSCVLYFIRSHASILLLRWTGIVWYATRDGVLFSLFFSLLAIAGIKVLIKFWDDSLGTKGLKKEYGLVALGILIVTSIYFKTYFGEAHRFVFPTASNYDDITDFEINRYRARNELAILRKNIEAIKNQENGFFRIFSPSNLPIYLAGAFQDLHLHEASIYESSIPQSLDKFYHTILLEKPSGWNLLANQLPYSQFPKHFHIGINLQQPKIKYDNFYIYNNDDGPALHNKNIEFWWELSQVKYLLLSEDFLTQLKQFNDFETKFKIVGNYPALGITLVRFQGRNVWGKYFFVPQKIIGKDQLNSTKFSDLEFLFSKSAGITDENQLSIRRLSNSKKLIRFQSQEDGYLIESESPNKNWALKRNGKSEISLPAFHIARALPVKIGMNEFELEYSLPYFWPLFWFGLMFPILYLLLVALYFWRHSPRVTHA